jgi:phosphoglycolate phosphatase
MDNIYFDLDGTLTDPKPGITRSIQYALRKLGREVPSEDELTWCIGPPLRASFATLLGDDSLADRALALYRERFAEIGLYENAVYPDIEHVLAGLARPGRRLFVATSKPAVYAKRIVEHSNWRTISTPCSAPSSTAHAFTRMSFLLTPSRLPGAILHSRS